VESAGAITLVKLDIDYLFAGVDRQGKRRYWYYRRNRRYIPITSPEGRRLQPGDAGFLEAYAQVHAGFDQPAATRSTTTGTIAHLIDSYRSSPEFKQLSSKTQRDYGRYLGLLKEKHGHRSVAQIPREAVFKLRDEFQATPRTANYLVSVLRLLLSFAEDRKQTFQLPPCWVNPARRPKKLKTGEGHRPWEEVEIAAYRQHWRLPTLERVLFETFLNTGRRGGDIAPMIRQQYFQGEIAVAQEKTGKRVWIPASRDLLESLDPWLEEHQHVVLFPTATGRPLAVDHMRHLMREAIRAAALPDECTLRGLRYTFATRAIELGLDWQMIESIVGHKTAEMAFKYTQQRRQARLTITTLDAARKGNPVAAKVINAADRSDKHPKENTTND
jgi:integrase